MCSPFQVFLKLAVHWGAAVQGRGNMSCYILDILFYEVLVCWKQLTAPSRPQFRVRFKKDIISTRVSLEHTHHHKSYRFGKQQ